MTAGLAGILRRGFEPIAALAIPETRTGELHRIHLRLPRAAGADRRIVAEHHVRIRNRDERVVARRRLLLPFRLVGVEDPQLEASAIGAVRFLAHGEREVVPEVVVPDETVANHQPRRDGRRRRRWWRRRWWRW